MLVRADYAASIQNCRINDSLLFLKKVRQILNVAGASQRIDNVGNTVSSARICLVRTAMCFAYHAIAHGASALDPAPHWHNHPSENYPLTRHG